MGLFSRARWGQMIAARSEKLAQALSKFGAFDVFELTNPAAAAADDLLAATASTVAPQTISTFLAGGVAKLAAYPRSIRITTAGATPADAPANAVITGTGPDGSAQTETVAVPQTATVVESLKAWKTVTSVAYEAAQGTAATMAIGTGNRFGFPWLPKVRAGAIHVVSEFQDGAAAAAAGTTQSPTTSPPFGTYTPNSAADGTKDYAVTVERA